MERDDEFKAGDRNSSKGTLPGQQEVQAGVFEDGQNRDTGGDVRPMKDGERYVYGDSRPDRTEAADTFVSLDDSAMMNTTREDLPEVHKEDSAFLEAHRVDQEDHIEARYRRDDPNAGEEAVLVPGNREGGNEPS